MSAFILFLSPGSFTAALNKERGMFYFMLVGSRLGDQHFPLS